MRPLPVVLVSAVLGLGAIGVAVKLSPASSSWASRTDWEHSHPGPDSGRVAIMLDALGRTDPVICEMIGDQVGNFWTNGERGGVGRLAAASTSPLAAKDSIGGHITDPRAINRLVAELSGPNACVRRVASKMLGRSAITTARLTSLLGDASPAVREAAALAAGQGDHHDVRLALEKAVSDRVAAVAAMSAWALGDLEDHESLPVLMSAAKGDESHVRLAAIWALGQLEDVRAVPTVLPALRDPDPSLRAMAAEVLGKLKSEETREALGNTLDDTNIEVRRAAASALSDFDESHKAPPGLVRALSSSDPELRHLAARALCSIADPTTTPTLIGLLSDADTDIRKNAIEALGNIGSPSAISGLTKALGDKDPQVRRAAAEALGEIKDK